MKSALFSVISTLALVSSASAFASHGSYTYKCVDTDQRDSDSFTLITNVDGQDNQITVDGAVSDFDGSYTARHVDAQPLYRYLPKEEPSDEGSTEYLVSQRLLNGASEGLFVEYGRGEGFNSATFSCTRQ